MGDILSQDEIDALLSVTETQKRICALLKKKGMDNRQLSTVLQRLRELVATDMAKEGIAAAVVALAGEMLGDRQLNKREQKTLLHLIGSSHDEALVEMETKKNLEMGHATPREAPRIITSYDFKHPARVNKDQLRTLENLHDNFARLLSSTLSGAMRAVVDVDTAFVDQTTYAEFIMSLSNPSCSYQFTLGPTNGQAILDFAMPVVFSVVDRTFGGKGSSQGVDARQLSQIEMGIINKIVKRVIEDLEATWEPILRVEISDIELETNPEFMQITAASEIVILLAFEVKAPNASGLVSLCYPFFTLESILPRLGQQTYVRQGRPDRESTIRQNRQRLAGARMPLEVEMGRGQITVDALREIRVGDVLATDTRQTQPCVVYVGDKPKYYARPFTQENGALGLQVIGKVSPLRYRDYLGE